MGVDILTLTRWRYWGVSVIIKLCRTLLCITFQFFFKTNENRKRKHWMFSLVHQLIFHKNCRIKFDIIISQYKKNYIMYSQASVPIMCKWKSSFIKFLLRFGSICPFKCHEKYKWLWYHSFSFICNMFSSQPFVFFINAPLFWNIWMKNSVNLRVFREES